MFAVFKLTRLKIIDNSGARLARCLYNYKVSKIKGSRVGDVILLTLKKVLPNKKVKKGELVRAVITCSADKYIRFSDHTIKAFCTTAVLLNSGSLLPKAKRARGIVLEELRHRFVNGTKVIALAPVVI